MLVLLEMIWFGQLRLLEIFSAPDPPFQRGPVGRGAVSCGTLIWCFLMGCGPTAAGDLHDCRLGTGELDEDREGFPDSSNTPRRPESGTFER